MDMPVINECAVEDCAYNRDRACHALAITVGDTRNPQCDTFFTSRNKGGDPSNTGRVGACKVSSCRHNTDYECRAPGITVGYQQSEVDCLTFAPA
ncbi:DUF1540 domain-containing protein [Streptomyces fradiae]|uniref:DUF1540 domain-containing protein n=1 Tax=Streptomyces fradiae TaxID=1906 RepID=UPI002942200C|nr:DUF1540 domain-containing protein [Streptomyces fradiae]WOI63310.1 DUF1540 domain-containing protein [Streptomyces fradiae]